MFYFMKKFEYRPWTSIIVMYFMCCTFENFSDGQNIPWKNITFSRKFGVFFDPPLLPTGINKSSGQNVTHYLEVVRSRFSLIFLTGYSEDSFKKFPPEIFIPSAVAELNKMTRSSSKKDTTEMQVYLTCNMDLSDDLIFFSKNNLTSTFENTKQIADKANQIHEGTVQHISINLDFRTAYLPDTAEIVNQLTIAKTLINEGRWKYKLGVIVTIELCESVTAGIDVERWEIFEIADFAIVAIVSDDISVSAQEFYWCAQRRLEKCESALTKKHEHLEVASMTLSLWSTPIDLVWYWRQLNDWAEKTNSTVFMMKAFDDLAPEHQLHVLGWWRVEYGNTTENGSTVGFPTLTEKQEDAGWFLQVLEYEDSEVNLYNCDGNGSSILSGNGKMANLTCHVEIPTIAQTLDTASSNTTSTRSVASTFKHDKFIVYFSTHFQRVNLGNQLNEEELIPILELVGTRFSTVMSALFPGELSDGSQVTSWSIPIAVAKLNLLHSRNFHRDSNQSEEHYLRLFLTYDQAHLYELLLDENVSEEEIEPNFKRLFDLTKQRADEANAVYNNTVQHIALRVRTTDFFSSIIQHLKYATEQISKQDGSKDNFSYKFGIILDISYCGRSSPTIISSLDYLLPFVSFVVFKAAMPFAEYFSLHVHTEAVIEEEYQAQLQFCLRKVRKSHPGIDVMFSAMWPDTELTGETNVTKMMWVWESMNSWAKKTNSTVLMYEAFDNFARRQKYTSLVTVGWWRNEDRCVCSKNTNEYRFVEKWNLQECVMNPPSGSEPLNGYSHVKFQTWTNNNFLGNLDKVSNSSKPQFDKDRFVVYYDTFDEIDKESYVANEDITDAFIGVVQTRFSKVMLKPMQEGNVIYKDMYTGIPRSAAKFYRLQDTSEDGGTMQVILSFDVSSVPLLTAADEESERTSFDAVLELANEANEIYPQTVVQLMLEYRDLNEENIEIAVNQISISRVKINKNYFYYQIGVILTDADCNVDETEFEDAPLFTLLPHVEVVVFTHWTTQRHWRMGVQQSVNLVTNEFSKCKRMIQKRFPRVIVSLYTSWSDTDENGKQNYTALVSYWREMNKFSIIANTTVILSKVFDSTDVLTHHEHRSGWWQPLANKTIAEAQRHSGIFWAVEEKIQLLPSRDRMRLYGGDVGTSGSFTIGQVTKKPFGEILPFRISSDHIIWFMHTILVTIFLYKLK